MQRPVIIETLGALIEHGHTMSAQCETCRHSARVDLEALAGRIGRDWVYVGARPPLTCSACGGRFFEILKSPP